MQKPIPVSSEDREAEGKLLLAKIHEQDYPKLTSWELNMVKDIREGMAVTRVRLIELREVVERIERERGT